jgi:hypothetical protein
MDDLDPDTVRMRAWEAIERTAGVKARLAERAERRQWQRSDLAARNRPQRLSRVSGLLRGRKDVIGRPRRYG